MVLALGVLNTIGADGSIGHEDSEESVLSAVGKSITPVFEPIGVEKDNWPASVAIFTGLFAKESVIGTMNGLYGQIDAKDGQKSEGESEEAETYSLVGGIKEAFASIPKNMSGVFGGLLDPFGIGGSIGELADEDVKSDNDSTINSLRRHFPKGVHQMYSFLLFVLLYIPCLAATGVVFREIGKLYGAIFVGYLTLLGWSVATIYHAVMVSHSSLWFCIGTSILAAMFGGFWCYGKKHRIDML